MAAGTKKQPIGTRWKALDLSLGAELFRRLDEDFPDRLKLIENGTEEMYEYRSSTSGQTYRLQLTKTETGWLGACSCPGTRKSETPGAIVPCKHLVALLMLDADCPLPGAGDYYLPDLKAIVEVGIFNDGTFPESTMMERIVFDKPIHYEAVPPAPHVYPAEPPEPIAGPSHSIVECEVRITGHYPMKYTHRCSSLPLVCTCPAAVAGDEGELRVGTANVAGAIGTAVHSIFEKIVMGEWNASKRDEIAKAAALAGCAESTDDVRMLSSMAWRLWNVGILDETGTQKAPPVKSLFQSPQTEVEVAHTMRAPGGETVTLTGRADVFEIIQTGPNEGRAVILDLKTGYKDRNHAEQLVGYAVGAMGQHKELQSVSLVVMWARLGYYDVLVMSREEVKDWVRHFLAYEAVWDGRTYVTGEHCTYCRRAASCEARARQLRTYADLFRNEGTLSVSSICDVEGNLVDPDTLAEWLAASRQIKACCEGFSQALADQIALVGAQPLAKQPGKALGFSERSKARVINAGKGWGVLRAHMSDEELASLVSIGLTPALDLVAKKAEKGKGASAKRELEAALRDADALPDVGKSRTLTVITINEGGE